jgi:AcrR family transcriptional regulator
VKSSQRRQETSDAILGAALVLLRENGYSGFRVADVVARSGASPGSLFRYFPSKTVLVRTALERSLASHLERLALRFAALHEQGLTRRLLVELLWEVISHADLAWMHDLYTSADYDAELRLEINAVLTAHYAKVDHVTALVVSSTGLLPEAEAACAVNLIVWSMQGLIINQRARPCWRFVA